MHGLVQVMTNKFLETTLRKSAGVESGFNCAVFGARRPIRAISSLPKRGPRFLQFSAEAYGGDAAGKAAGVVGLDCDGA